MKQTSRTKKPAARRAPTTATTRKTAAKPKTAVKKAPVARATKRVPAAATKRKTTPPSPLQKRAIFIDVENTSSEATLLNVLEHLQVDRKQQPTEVIAIGNWKSVGTKVARTLASLGAQLVHSAPAPGVRDWSDLWIAVNAGRWLAHAAPGDQLDIVSDDRAFDAVHDAAASLGVVCTRISYRHLPGAPAVVQAPAAAAAERPHRPRRRGGRGRRRAPLATPQAAPATPAQTAPPVRPAETATLERAEAHAASQEQIRAILARLTNRDSTRWINLDLLANALKAEGFSRPPGSPRLITRVRSIKGVELNPNGMVRLADDEAGSTGAAAPAGDDATAAQPAARRPRRRGGRRHRRRPNDEGGGAAATSTDDSPDDAPSEDTAETS